MRTGCRPPASRRRTRTGPSRGRQTRSRATCGCTARACPPLARRGCRRRSPSRMADVPRRSRSSSDLVEGEASGEPAAPPRASAAASSAAAAASGSSTVATSSCGTSGSPPAAAAAAGAAAAGAAAAGAAAAGAVAAGVTSVASGGTPGTSTVASGAVGAPAGRRCAHTPQDEARTT